MQSNETTIPLTLGVVNGVLQYLATRPYHEVYQLIQAIQQQASESASESPAPAEE